MLNNKPYSKSTAGEESSGIDSGTVLFSREPSFR